MIALVHKEITPLLLEVSKNLVSVNDENELASSLMDEDIVVVSEFLTNYIPGAFEGVNRAVEIRLKGNANRILILSFQTIEALAKEDIYGILALEGTAYIRLPATPKLMRQAFEGKGGVSADSLLDFRYETCKKMLAKKLIEINHGSGFGDKIFFPLISGCWNVINKIGSIDDVRTKIGKIKEDLNLKEITEFINIVLAFPEGVTKREDLNLGYVLDFGRSLKIYAQYLDQLYGQKEMNCYSIIDSINSEYYPYYSRIKELTRL